MASFLDQTGLSYFYNKLKSVFSLKSHTHSASSLNVPDLDGENVFTGDYNTFSTDNNSGESGIKLVNTNVDASLSNNGLYSTNVRSSISFVDSKDKKLGSFESWVTSGGNIYTEICTYNYGTSRVASNGIGFLVKKDGNFGVYLIATGDAAGGYTLQSEWADALGRNSWIVATRSDWITLETGWSVRSGKYMYNYPLHIMQIYIELKSSSELSAGYVKIGEVADEYRPKNMPVFLPSMHAIDSSLEINNISGDVRIYLDDTLPANSILKFAGTYNYI